MIFYSNIIKALCILLQRGFKHKRGIFEHVIPDSSFYTD